MWNPFSAVYSAWVNTIVVPSGDHAVLKFSE